MNDEEEIEVQDGGILELSYRGWDMVNASIFTYSQSIVDLDLSFNCLVDLPAGIGKFRNMTKFNCSCNHLKSLPPEIGRLRKLTILKANGNNLCNLPDEIGLCISLREINLTENNIISLPDSIGDCISLKMLKVRNNDLNTLPLTLSNIKSQELTIDCENNNNLEMIPASMRCDSNTILWILGFLYEKTTLIKLIQQTSMEMSIKVKAHNEMIVLQRANIESLTLERDALLKELASVKHYMIARRMVWKCKAKMTQFINFCEKMLPRSSKISMEYS